MPQFTPRNTKRQYIYFTIYINRYLNIYIVFSELEKQFINRSAGQSRDCKIAPGGKE
jgi:hypothetical protein